MPAADFSLSTNAYSADFGAAYILFATDDAPLSGQVFLDMGEHSPIVDGEPQIRSMVVARFFALAVENDPLGNPRVLARFHPGDPGHGADAAIYLGEPGRMHLDLGYPLDTVDTYLRDLVSDTVIALAHEFLTDERAARYRHSCAHRRRDEVTTALDAVDALRQRTYQRLTEARADVNASWALVQTLRAQN
ncbi:hypothetical protein [Nocardia sp. NPDC003979]